jgi:selenocysteine lyase/cysteine desulfurase
MPLRKRFPIFQQKVYLNSCSKGALSVDVRRAYEEYLCDWDTHGSPWELWLTKQEAVRHAFAQFIGATPPEIAIASSVSAAISGLASALDFTGPRNKIVLSDFEFPTVGQIWRAQEQRGARLHYVKAAGNRIPLERFADAIDDRTLLVSITHVCYRNGARLDVPAIVEMARRKGAWVLLDTYQSLGTMPVDAQKLDVDFLVGGALKYLLGSSGLAFLYTRRQLIPQLEPTVVGWLGQANIFAMDHTAHTPAPDARRFETGTPPVPNLYAALAGIRLIQRVGMDAIQKRLAELTGALKEGAMRRGFHIVTPIDPRQHGAMIALRSSHVELLVKWLEKDGIVASSRDGNLRISPHFYNNQSDIDRLLDALTRAKDLL